MANSYTVFVDDNYHYMDESERYRLGEFPDCTAAVAACKQIVEEFFSTCDLNTTDAELYHQYVSFGEDPWVKSDDPGCKFSAWDYARELARELARKR
jgi:hypothetical protein